LHPNNAIELKGGDKFKFAKEFAEL